MENQSAVQLYLELLKKTILFEIWLEYEPYLPASLHISKELSYEPVTVPLPLFLKQYVENHNLKIVDPNVSKMRVKVARIGQEQHTVWLVETHESIT